MVTGSVMPVMSISWNASLPIKRLPTCPVMQTIGDESSMAVARPVTMLVAPGPDVAMATPDPSGRAGIAVGHVRRALLVAYQRVADRVVEQRVIGGENRAARIAEDVRHAFAHQALPENLRPSHFAHFMLLRANATAAAVTAPSAADDTSRAYLAMTPRGMPRRGWTP